MQMSMEVQRQFADIHLSLQRYVQEEIMQTVAVMLKRDTLDNPQFCDLFIQDVAHLISSGNLTMVRFDNCLSCAFVQW